MEGRKLLTAPRHPTPPEGYGWGDTGKYFSRCKINAMGIDRGHRNHPYLPQRLQPTALLKTWTLCPFPHCGTDKEKRCKMGQHRLKLIVPFYKDLSYTNLKSRERMQNNKQAQNKTFPVPNRKKPQRSGTTSSGLTQY